MARVSLNTLGCKLNYAETSAIEEDFRRHGYDVVPFGAAAEVTVVNTCSVTLEAERKCRNVVRRALRANPDAFVAVVGCYAQLRPEELAAIDGVDVVLGADEKARLFELVREFSKREKTQVHVSCIDDVTAFAPASAAGSRTRAFLKVQDGCDYTCAFCTIPAARGSSRWQPIQEVVSGATQLARDGYREVVLSGVNIGLYGGDPRALLRLLRALDEVEGIERFRISSIEPNLLSDEIVDFVASSSRFQPHFHIPLQSGDDFVLGKMRRRYTRSVYQERVNRIRQQLPHASIGADVIVGFPAEDETRFEATRRFIEDLPVSYLHVFTYSERPETTAVEQLERMGGSVVQKRERRRRNRALRLLSEEKSRDFRRSHLREVRPVLWEGEEKDGRMLGYTDNYIRVERPFEDGLEGRIEDVVLEEPTPRGTVRAQPGGFVSLL